MDVSPTRLGRYTHVRWFEQMPEEEELSGRVADFDWVTNLVSDPKCAAVRDALRKRTTEIRDQYGGPCRPTPADK